MTVINISGTSGSGKTSIVRQVSDSWADPARLSETIVSLGKVKQVGVYYLHHRTTLMGKYDATCGGCDSMSWKGSADDIERIIIREHKAGHHVIFEGLLVSTWGMERLQRLDRNVDHQLYILNLNTPLEECLDRVRARRLAAGNTKPLNTENTEYKWHAGQPRNKKQLALGLNAEWVSSENGAARVKELLNAIP